jgi:lysophospholipase L1-like esterase
MSFLAMLWDVVGLLVLLVLFLEFGVTGLRRLSRRIRHDRSSAPMQQPSGLDWAPFVHWRQQSFRSGNINVDERGLRVTPGEAEAGGEALRIFCLGGSTAFGVGVRDGWTVPAVLQRRLSEMGHRVAVTNYGQLAYICTQEVIALQQLLKSGTVPQVVVFYDGFNDMFSAEWKSRADAIRGEEQWRAEFNLLAPERLGDLVRAGLAGAFPHVLLRIREWTGLQWAGGLARSTRVPLTEGLVPALARDVAAVYAANVRTVRALAREYGFQAVFVWEPVLATKHVKSADEIKFESRRAVDTAMQRQFCNAVIAAYRQHPALAGAPDIVDLSAMFDDRTDSVYIDFAHLSESGNAAVAEAMLSAVTSALAAASQRQGVGPH